MDSARRSATPDAILEARDPAQSPLRWGVLGLLFLATLINYIDRQTVAVLAPVLKEALHLTNVQYASIGSTFLLAYALSMWLFGGVFDRVGNRRGYALAVGVWSAAAIAHAFVRGVAGLRVVRFALGVGESGNWPGATRTIAAWFAPRQRALAIGVCNTSAALGPALALPLVALLAARWGWRATFVATGSLGALWIAAWLAFYPRRESGAGVTARPVPWPVLLRRRQVWGIVLARFFGDPIWWLYLNWLPLYLHDARGFSMARIALAGWVPFVAAGLGSLSGGWTSGRLLAAGWSVDRARKTAILIGAALMPAGIGAAYVASPVQALACISITLFGFQFWVGNVQTLPGDFFAVEAVGSIAGFAGTAAGLGAMIFTMSTGWVVDHFSYTPILVAAGLLGPLGTVVLFVVAGRVHRLERGSVTGGP
jgi:ACS family hexuronate transporter-like MFS transporter